MTLPQPGRVYRAEAAGEAVWLWGPLQITGSTETAWQVGAWSRPEVAASVVEALSNRLGDGAAVWPEPTAEGLTRVRVRWPAEEPADAKNRLAAMGYQDAFRVAGAGAVLITGAGGSIESSSEIVLTPAGDWATAVGDRRYRGRFRLRTGRAGVLLINELPMEDYLRGVVPVEMGPYQFPELEALKAQAVAARTYAVAHLGDHDDEGWDICATPACQAYSGAEAEHPLSDRAVEETAGLVAVFGGAPIDAMYTSTCGGHTEDAAVLFAGRGAPYLVGVPCSWELQILGAGDHTGVGQIENLSGFRRFLALRALGLEDESVGPEELVRAVTAVCGGPAGLCGGEYVPLPPDPSWSGWERALLAAAGLEGDGPLVRQRYFGVSNLLGLADLFDVPLQPTDARNWNRGWHLEAAAAVLEIQGVIVKEVGEAVLHPEQFDKAGRLFRGLAIHVRGATKSEYIHGGTLFSRWGTDYKVEKGVVSVSPGTTLERYRVGDRTIALVVVRSGGDADADRRSAWRSWIRDRSWGELEASLGVPDLERVEITRRGRSGRVVGLRAIDREGRGRVIEGFEVRRALDLPETLFEMSERRLPDGSRSIRFLGRGWGHGVGLCQNGAYGLARAGMTFDEILTHYYTGVTIEPWNPR
jgi:stage II sporulation protein D